MRTVKAVLPGKMPAVFAGLGLRDHSYQDLSSNEVHTPSGIAVEASSHPSSQKFRGFIITFIVGAVILSSLLLLTTTRGPTMKSVNDSAWMEGSKLGTAYCKTSCTSQCSSYFSVYGPLCCDWAEGELSSSTSQSLGIKFSVTFFFFTWISNKIRFHMSHNRDDQLLISQELVVQSFALKA